ncbi:type 1 glutamine amidotransferase [Rubrivivax gelatinosus]|uniref:Amidotransferase n=1 Tax=Rubrivivax gelatinosus TaxID=28068 RepID=A0ABS1E0L3_RUBGE|nr:type 1 glutamine amidotransferase [Rubrivivax gelatinosus]MBK1715323.1 amidotransferase [Rubrivivax gelatinosus]
MRAHYFQHVPFEGLGSIEPWLQGAGYAIGCTRFFAGESVPRLEDVDFLVVMGGPMSVNDEAQLTWLRAEKAFIRRAIEAGKPVLGICLGAQLIADTMGGRVFPNALKEIGWLQIEATGPADAALFRFAPALGVFQWHGETFTLPPGAVQLARSTACENQAFQLGATVIGLQFHLETTPESARALVENCRDELVPGPWVQGEAEILAAPPGRYRALNEVMSELLFHLHSCR